MTINELQPIRFTDLPTNCKCNSVETIPVQADDITQFQFELDVCDFMPNIVTNGDFDATDGWQYDGFAFTSDTVVSDADVTGTLETVVSILGDGAYYQIELDLTSTSGQPLYVYFGKYKIAELTESGNYILSGVCESRNGTGTLDTLRILSPRQNACTIERIACYMLENKFAIFVMDINDAILWTRTLADDIADANYTFFKLERNTVTVSFDWDFITDATNGLNLDYGCYKIGLSSICENTNSQFGVLDPNFYLPITLSEISYPWKEVTSSNATVIIEDKILKFTGSSIAVGTATVEEENASPESLTVTFVCQLVIDSIAGANVVVSIGGTNSATYTTAGTKNFTIVTAGSPTNLRVTISDTLLGVTGVCQVSKLDCYLAYNDEVLGNTQMTVDNISNAFNFQETQPCTVLLAGTNNEDAYGLNFEGAMYTPKLRWKGSFRSLPTDSKVEHYTDVFGNKKISYFDNRLKKELRLQEVPEYLANWLSLFEGFNQVWVNELEYVVAETPEVTYNRFCDTAKVSMEMDGKRQDLTNVNKRGVVAVTDYLNILVRAFDEQEPIIFIDGDEIALKG